MHKETFIYCGVASDIFREYSAFEKLKSKINDIYLDFAVGMGIEAVDVKPTSASLSVRITANDMKLYSSQLYTPAKPGSYCMFKSGSFISKAWRTVMKELGVKTYPAPTYSSYFPSKNKVELGFGTENGVYLRLSGKLDAGLPACCTEITGSEFYNRFEKINHTTSSKPFAA